MTTRLHRFLSLSWGEQRVLVEAVVVVSLVRLGLRVWSFARVRRGVAWLGAGTGTARRGASRSRSVWAIRAASRIVPGRDTCLVCGLTGLVLLGRRGYPVAFRIGVKPDTPDGFGAHAWVETENEIVIGGPGAAECDSTLHRVGSP